MGRKANEKWKARFGDDWRARRGSLLAARRFTTTKKDYDHHLTANAWIFRGVRRPLTRSEFQFAMRRVIVACTNQRNRIFRSWLRGGKVGPHPLISP